MPTFRLTLAYDGTGYVGWQRQPAGVSIQQLVEEALAPLSSAAVTVAAAGRTDAGVHASGQVASVRLDTAHTAATIRRAANARLPPAVRVIGAEQAVDAFHARFDAETKRYRYRIASDAFLSPFDRWFAWHLPVRLDEDVMRRAGAVLVGRHDFASFQAAGGRVSDAVRTIVDLELVRRGQELQIEVEADGFLRHMVRAIVGTLVEIGTGRRAPETMAEVLAIRDRRAAGETAPACGLTLLEVRYARRPRP